MCVDPVVFMASPATFGSAAAAPRACVRGDERHERRLLSLTRAAGDGVGGVESKQLQISRRWAVSSATDTLI